MLINLLLSELIVEAFLILAEFASHVSIDRDCNLI